MRRRTRWWLALLIVAGSANIAPATSVSLADPTVVLERLPSSARAYRDARTPLERTRLARERLALAHERDDPALAAQAYALLRAIPASERSADAWFGLAAAQQYLHDFDASVRAYLVGLRARPEDAGRWLELAQVLKIDGAVADARRACVNAGTAGLARIATVCELELRVLGTVDADDGASRQLHVLRTDASPLVSAWALQTQLELCRQGRLLRCAPFDETVRAWRALRSVFPSQERYLRAAEAAAWLRNGDVAGAHEALRALAPIAGSDKSLLLTARAQKILGDAGLQETRALMTQRQRDAVQLGASGGRHAREYAQFELYVNERPELALRWAQDNLRLQREAQDYVLAWQAAAAAGRTPLAMQLRTDAQRRGWSISESQWRVPVDY